MLVHEGARNRSHADFVRDTGNPGTSGLAPRWYQLGSLANHRNGVMGRDEPVPVTKVHYRVSRSLEQAMNPRLGITLILISCTGFAQESDRALQQEEEADRIQREQRELHERAQALKEQLETSRQVLQKQKKLIEALEKTIRKIEKKEGGAE